MLRHCGRTAKAKAWRWDWRGSLLSWSSPADLPGRGHIGEWLIPAMPFKPQIKADPLHEPWPKTVHFEISSTPSGLSYNVCECWDLSSQVIYVKGTFVTCTRNCSLSLKIHLPLFLFITESWFVAGHSTTRKKVVFSSSLASQYVHVPMFCPGESGRQWYVQVLEPALREAHPSSILLPKTRPLTNSSTVGSFSHLHFIQHLLKVNYRTEARLLAW